jgi:hypothetical protein
MMLCWQLRQVPCCVWAATHRQTSSSATQQQGCKQHWQQQRWLRQQVQLMVLAAAQQQLQVQCQAAAAPTDAGVGMHQLPQLMQARRAHGSECWRHLL